MYVKEVYLPMASVKKQMEMETLIKKVHHPVRERVKILPSQTVTGSPANREEDLVVNEEDELDYSQSNHRTSPKYKSKKPPKPVKQLERLAEKEQEEELPKRKFDFLKRRDKNKTP
jgi:hypothetical protein